MRKLKKHLANNIKYAIPLLTRSKSPTHGIAYLTVIGNHKIKKEIVRHWTFFIFGLLTNIIFGQQLSYKSLPVDTIVIESFSCIYHFDKKGTNTCQGDYYTIAYEKARDKYIVSDYKRESIKTTYEPKTSKKDVKHFTKYKSTVVQKNIVDSLLNALSIRYKRPTFDNIGLTRENFFQLTNEKHIRSIAKLYKSDWRLKMSYTTQEKNKIIFRDCQAIDTFNLFLSNTFDTSSYVMVTDFANVINVFIKTASKTFVLEGKYPNAYKQPWYAHSDKSKLASILNFDINTRLLQILPDNFYGVETIGNRALTESYIKWYLQRKDIIEKDY